MARDKAGQPPFEPDYVLLEQIAGLFPTDEEIAVILGCSKRTIGNLKVNDEKYIKTINDVQQKTKMKLRQLQMGQAMGGNTTMLIFLGKQKLGQADSFKHSGDPAAPMETRVTLNLSEEQMTVAVKALKSETGE